MDKILYALNPATSIKNLSKDERNYILITRAIGWGIPVLLIGYALLKII